MHNLDSFLNGYIDILTIGESKLDESFPTSQFVLPGYQKPFRLDKTSQSGGLLTYVKTDIPARQLFHHKFEKDMQVITIEINLRKQKWLVVSIYRPPSQNLVNFLTNLSEALDFYNRTYDNIIVAGDFNSEPTHPVFNNFMNLNNLYNHIKHKTCWKSKNGSCIDLILSNRKHSLQYSSVIETGLSDHHLLIYTMLKIKYIKLPPVTIRYRQYKNFNNEQFLAELQFCIANNVIASYKEFENIFTNILDKHAPLKAKLLRANNRLHITKNLRVAIMKRSKLKNIANKSNNPNDMANYRRQRNLVVNMNRKAKKSYFNSIDANSSSKHFWKACKPLFSNKSNAINERIQIVEEGELVNNSSEIATIFNNYFNRITDNLNIPIWYHDNLPYDDSMVSIINKFKSHPSILNIKTKLRNSTTFNFTHVSENEVKCVINSLNGSKKVSGSIPVKILKLAVHVCTPILTTCFNDAIDHCSFLDELKLADIIPIHKKESTTIKSNYRPISLLPAISKIYEKLIANQITKFSDQFLSKYLCGFRKGYSSQYALLNMLRDWQKCLKNSGKVGAILMDLSKAFDCLPHDLLIAKMEAYGFGITTLKFMFSYLSKRKHRVRIGSFVSDWLEVLLGVPQGSVLGPILFNIFINDLLYSTTSSSICNFADDNTMYVCDTTIENVISRLKCDITNVSRWFECNHMVTNPEKFHIIFPGTENSNIALNINGEIIGSSNIVTLLGIDIDDTLSFQPYVKKLCKRANQKTNALLRIRHYLNIKKAKYLFNAFVMSPFNYCPLVWMFCGKQSHTHSKFNPS